MRRWIHELGLGEFILIYTGLDRGICLLIFLGRNARGFGIKRLEMVSVLGSTVCVFCFILFEVMWAWFFSLCRGLKRSCANSRIRIGPDVVLRFKISNGLFCFGLGLMD